MIRPPDPPRTMSAAHAVSPERRVQDPVGGTVPRIVGEFVHQPEPRGAPSIVDEDVDLPKRSTVASTPASTSGLLLTSPATKSHDRRRPSPRAPACPFGASAVEHDPRPVGDESLGDTSADASGAPRDEGHLAVKGHDRCTSMLVPALQTAPNTRTGTRPRNEQSRSSRDVPRKARPCNDGTAQAGSTCAASLAASPTCWPTKP